MRINVYTEELILAGNNPVAAEVVTADYVSSRTGEPMTNHGIRIYLKSHPDLHYVPPRDDDRSAVTFWCGPSRQHALDFWRFIHRMAFEPAERDGVDTGDGGRWTHS
jgi:hypothetical protein